ncbi:hypothetical protein B0J12DRAFT_641339 [Macrophomina phaseolina]|uniref:Uncharacterized protein n=1 Tax=Macrophomina phaseolina TaxID=35725 RepID=A0ABQ8GRE1_9PEZI|nr:hypothetical protein B0J12DRAFT_641339 [Macrophomina phaseolina]
MPPQRRSRRLNNAELIQEALTAVSRSQVPSEANAPLSAVSAAIASDSCDELIPDDYDPNLDEDAPLPATLLPARVETPLEPEEPSSDIRSSEAGLPSTPTPGRYSARPRRPSAKARATASTAQAVPYTPPRPIRRQRPAKLAEQLARERAQRLANKAQTYKVSKKAQKASSSRLRAPTPSARSSSPFQGFSDPIETSDDAPPSSPPVITVEYVVALRTSGAKPHLEDERRDMRIFSLGDVMNWREVDDWANSVP